MSDTIGWIATCIFVWASLDVAHKNVRGLWLMVLGNLGFMVMGFLTGLSSLVGVSAIMICLDFYGIRKWSKNG